MNMLDFFQLEREPFSNAPDARFFYNSEEHSQALLRLMYAVDSNKGLAVLVGGIGAGKTTLARRMLANLPEERYESSLLVMVHSGITTEWLLTRIALQLGVPEPADDRLKLLKQLYERLVEIDGEGRRAVVLIDEAQMLQSREIMEEFRGLLNLELPGKKLLNLVFFGLSELEDNLHLDEPLAQRVAVKYHLRSLTVAATEAYVNYRIRVAGGERSYFTPEALGEVHAFSGGVPRLINTICDNGLLEAYLLKKDVVEASMVRSVAENLGLFRQPTARAVAPEQDPELDEIEKMLEGLEQKA